MYNVHVLRSIKTSKRYIGYTSKDLFTRLEEHNIGGNKWTRTNRPFKIIYKEIFKNKTEAIKREKFLKSGQGRKSLDGLVGK